MKKILLLLSAAILPFISIAQSENALYFDNIDDYVSVPNASAVIAGSNAISMTLWVYPENAFPSFPDYDGIGGFRNNTDADFYLVQLTPTDVEARFRNSSGIAFDIIFTGLLLNTWQHFAMTYDGATLSLYHNGVLTNSIAASGNIATSNEPFNLGMTAWPQADFYLNGKLDETSLWSKALSPSEITCIYTGAIDPLQPDLELYYRFNQGIAGGNNGSVNMLSDATASINGILNTFLLAGGNSNWVTGVVTQNASLISDVLCQGSTYNFGTQVITVPGSYYAVFPSSGGCDSLVQLNLSAVTFNTTISQVGPLLTAQQTGAAYQWINCSTGNTTIPGATNQSYTAASNGQYAVIISFGGCSDTTVCATVTNVGIEEPGNVSITANPNPFTDNIVLTCPVNYLNRKLKIFDIAGRELFSTIIYSSEVSITTASWSASIYFISIEGISSRLKIVK